MDSRWLTRALQIHYKELLSAGDQDTAGLRVSTPQSYLEKIFQITYALGPMDQAHFKSYVEHLAGVEKAPEATATPPATATAPPVAPPPPMPGGSQPSAQAVSTATPRPRAEEKPEPAASATSRSPLAPPQAVRISYYEQDLLVRLLPLIPTPRIAKRIVNVYRLVKSGKTSEELELFRSKGRAESCLVMLAILFGCPAAASLFFRKLHERTHPFQDGSQTLAVALEKLATEKDPGHAGPKKKPERKRTAQAAAEPAKRSGRQSGLDRAKGEIRSIAAILEAEKLMTTVEACAEEPLAIARYSLVCGQDWHLWPHPKPKV